MLNTQGCKYGLPNTQYCSILLSDPTIITSETKIMSAKSNDFLKELFEISTARIRLAKIGNQN